MTLLTDDTAAPDIETAAEERRAAAFRSQPEWKDLPLLWTITRETLYYWLRIPPPRLPDDVREAFASAKDAVGGKEHSRLVQRANDLHAEFQASIGLDYSYYRNATIILYLAAHQSPDWQPFVHDRSRFLIAIETWADDNIGTSEMTKVASVTDELIANAEANRAIPRPKGGDKGNEEGN